MRKIKGFYPKKMLGQHFLADEVAIEKIVGFLDLKPSDTVVEIGPGHGELTLEIAKKALRVVAIEKDRELAAQLGDLRISNIEVVIGDALRALPVTASTLKTGGYKLIGNIPYYITGKLLRKIGEFEKPPTVAILTIQKEVAERVSAGQSKMNLLAAAVQIWARVQLVLNLPRKIFFPPPKVDSAVIRLIPKKQKLGRGGAEKYYKAIRAIFRQPRKTLYNNLRTAIKNEADVKMLFGKLEISEKIKIFRPQELDLRQIKIIANFLATKF